MTDEIWQECEACHGSGIDGYPSACRFDVDDCPYCVDGVVQSPAQDVGSS